MAKTIVKKTILTMALIYRVEIGELRVETKSRRTDILSVCNNPQR